MRSNPLWKSLKVIWDDPKFVFINEKRLEELAEEWTKEDFLIPAWREEVFPENPAEFIEFIGIVNSINFCFLDPYNPQQGRYFFNWRGKKWEGAFGMTAALSAAMEKGKPILDHEFLQNLNEKEMKDIFCRDSEIPLFEERLKILKKVGDSFEKHNFHNFRDIFEIGKWRAFDYNGYAGILSILINTFPSFGDTSYHRDTCRTLYFHKRVQLLLMVYQGRALSDPENYKFIEDYELLGPPADYELPKFLHSVGVLEYDLALADKIYRQKIILPNTSAEQEIRAQTINVMLQLQGRINVSRQNRDKINMLGLDYRIWSAGRNLKDIPHHLTPTIAY